MGLTIHYRGKIDFIPDVEHLTEELKDFSDTLTWDSRLWNEDWSLPNTATIKRNLENIQIKGHIPLRGIVLYPHENCEPLSLTFTREGYLTNSIGMALVAEKKLDIEKEWQSTKTQFAPIGIHIAIIKLLKYLKKRYISNLEVHDEGGYWESEDVKELQNRHNRISNGIDIMSDALKEIPSGVFGNKTADEIADFIEELINRKLGN